MSSSGRVGVAWPALETRARAAASAALGGRNVGGRDYGETMTIVDEGKIDEQAAAEHIHGICLKTGPPRRVGIEIEWLVRDARNPAIGVSAERITDAMSGFAAAPGLPTSSSPGVLPSGAPLTTEPGGQLELSSLPADSLADCVRATVDDLAALRAAADAAGLELAGFGLDPLRPPRRVLELPRYAAMEAFFDRGGPWGRQMMCTTASIQVCLDAGDDSDGRNGYRHRWRLLHAIGPVLVAAFANSPLRAGRPTGWLSSRQQVWSRMDPGRTRPPTLGPDPREAWARYALDAELMCVRNEGSADWSAPAGLTLRDWVRGDAADRMRPPSAGDLEYHLSTLFPPVRPHGHFELRMIDAQRGDGWIVPLAVVSRAVRRRPGGRRRAGGRRAAVGGPRAGRGMAVGPAEREPVAARRPARAGRPGHRRGQPGVLRGGAVGA